MADELFFDWDESNIRHVGRHLVNPEEAEEVMLNGPVELDYEITGGEERFVAVGVTSRGRFLTVVWTDRAGAVGS